MIHAIEGKETLRYLKALRGVACNRTRVIMSARQNAGLEGYRNTAGDGSSGRWGQSSQN